MSKVVLLMKNKDISARTLWLIALLLVAGKVFLCSFQYILASPDLSPIDDTLMVELAQSIVDGNWLGEYNWLTLGKHSFFALWLAGVHVLGINYLVAGQLLFAAACLLVLAAVKPLFKTNVARLFIFGIILFMPASWAEYTLRVYRDNIYPSLVLIAFAGLLGAFVRFGQPVKKTIGYYLLAGLGFGTAWLTHEDNALLLPFIACAVVLFLFVLWRRNDVLKKVQKTVILLLPLCVFALCILSWCGVNYYHYGRFIISDFTSPEFNDAMGALLRVCPEDQERYLPLPRSTRQALYEVSPTFATLADALETDEMYNDYGSVPRQEISSSALHWAIRRAAGRSGYYQDAATAQAFFTQVAQEVNRACDDGRIAAGPPYSGTFAPFKSEYVAPAIRAFGQEVKLFLFYEQTEPTTELSIALPEQSEEWESFLHCTSTKAAAENADTPYYSVVDRLAYGILNTATWMQRILVWPMLLLSLLWLVLLGKQTIAIGKKQQPFSPRWLGDVLMLGFFLSGLLRMVAVAYLFAFSIDIDVYLMYLASACPLMLVFLAYAAACCFEWWRARPLQGKAV